MAKINLFQIVRGIAYPLILAGTIYSGVNANKTSRLIGLAEGHIRCLIQDIKAGALECSDYELIKQEEKQQNKELNLPYLNNIYHI